MEKHLFNPDLEKELESLIYRRLEKRLEELNSEFRNLMIKATKL